MGFGNVGKAFLQLIKKKDEDCRKRYGIDFYFAAVFRSQKSVIFSDPQKSGSLQEGLLRVREGDRGLEWQEKAHLRDVLDAYQPGVLVECTPTDSQTGGPGLEHIHLALERGWHVVTANKGPLVIDYKGLMEKARRKNLSLKISGATAAALPTLDVALHSLAGSEISKIEGILNGTTNYILTKMAGGFDFKTALREAQEKGIAETDPSQDVDGWDTAYKILLLTNALFDSSFSLGDVKVEGITKMDPSYIKESAKQGKKLKLLGRMTRKAGAISLNVSLTAIDKSHPLFNVDDTEKGITFETDTMSSITVIGGKSDPTGTAAAMLKDIINIYLQGQYS